MPTYEYLCKNCGERFEKVQSFSARPLKKHETCGGDLQKVFHASGVVFKGPGFYATDSRPARSSADSSSSDSKDSKDSSDSKDSTPKSTETTKKDTPAKKDSKSKTSTPRTAAAAD
jgi:putative FmdB family regulatory protein